MGFIDEEAFHSNDIRGIYPSEINEAIAYHVGGAFATLMKAKKIAVGRDARMSSPALARALIAGITDAGCEVIYLGVVDTPRVYFASGKLKIPAMMVTASHNPSEYNGIKAVLSGAKPLSSDHLRKLAESLWKKSENRGQVVDKDISAEYFSFILKYINKKNLRPLKVVIDAGNGVSGLFVQALFSSLPLDIIPLYFDPDGAFPNHVPNPAIPSNLKDLQCAVVQSKADFGIAFDGDADRVFFVDELGKAVPSSVTASLLAKHMLSKHKGIVVHTALSSRIVPEIIKEAGGIPIAEKIGHAFMKDRMRNEQAVFGAEESGHYYYKSNYYADSAFITALLFYEVISGSSKKLSSLSSGLMKYYKPEEISIKTGNKDAALTSVLSWCQKLKPEKKKIFDGTTFVYKDCWINVRASNTEPLIRITMEADSEKKGREAEKKLRDFIKSLKFNG